MEKVKQLLNELLTRRPDGHAGLHGCLGGPPRHSADGLGTPRHAVKGSFQQWASARLQQQAPQMSWGSGGAGGLCV